MDKIKKMIKSSNLIIPLSLTLVTFVGGESQLLSDSMTINDIGTQTNLGSYNISFNSSNSSTLAGMISGTLNGANASFFCFDLSHNIYPGNYNSTTVVAPTTQPINTQIAVALLNKDFTPSLTAAQTQAMQLAVWTILYDWNGSYQPTQFSQISNSNNQQNAFYLNPSQALTLAVQNQISTYLGDAAALGTNNLQFGNWNMMLNPTYQTLAGIATPEPTTYVLMGSLLALTALYLPNRKKNLG